LSATDSITQLRGLLEGGRRFEFLVHAQKALARSPGDMHLALGMLGALVEMGLGGPAREVLQLYPALAGAGGEGAKLLQAVHAAPHGRVPWTGLEDTLHRNKEALLRHRPHLEQAAQACAAQVSKAHLYRTTQGEYLVGRRRPGGLREWLYCLSPTMEEERVQLPPRGKLGPTAVIGLRVGGLIQRIYTDTSNILLTLSHPLYLIEPDPLRFAAWMHVADHSALLNDERVYLFLGDGALEEFEQTLANAAGVNPPSLFVNQSGRAEAADGAQEVAERVESSRTDELAKLKQALAERYRRRDAAYWAERFAKKGLVLGLTSRYTTMLKYSMRDALDALRELGWQTETIIEAADHHQFSEIEVCRRILESDPVLIVLLDHLRYEISCLPRNLPLLTWIQDPMPKLLCLEAGASIGPFDFVCGYYMRRCIEEFGYREDCFVPTVIPIAQTIFHDGPLDAAAEARYACDVSFVSNASEPIEHFYHRSVEGSPPQHRPLLEEIYQRVTVILQEGKYLSYPEGAPALVREAARVVGLRLSDDDVERIKNNFTYRLFDWGRRQQTLEWVADWARRTRHDFRIYGRGWESHPRLAPFAAGVIEHGAPLRCVNRSSKLALQLIPSGFRHQRSYELLASGALPLTRYCEADFEFLPIEEYVRRREAGRTTDPASTTFPRLERVVFRTPQEFEALAERFLADDDHRQEVLEELREVVMRDHTYGSVLARVMDHIQNGLEQEALAALPA